MARKPKPEIPQRPEELTVAFFNDVLTATEAAVTAVDLVEIGVGIGFVGDIYRCKLTWDRDDYSLPASVVVKVPTTRPPNRAVGEALLCYEREITLYRETGGRLALPMPEHLYSAMDPNPAPWLAGALEFVFDHLPLRAVNWLVKRLLDMPERVQRRYLLVMEDIVDARPATQYEGGNLDDAHEALRLLARFHAAGWMNQPLLDDQPLIWALDRTPRVTQAGYLRNRDEFVERFGQRVDPAVLAHIDRIQDELPETIAALTCAPWTVLHGDYRLDNILFRGDDITVLDYQLMLWGRAGWDVSYFITTALEPHHQIEEESLLRTYHDALGAAGVTDYSFDELVADHETSKGVIAHRVVASGDAIDTDIDGRDDTLFDMMVDRVVGWMDP